MARIHGYALSPRPPDAVEMAVDSQIFGVGGLGSMGMGGGGVGVSGTWPLIPNPEENPRDAERMRGLVADTLAIMSDPSRAIATVIVSEGTVFSNRGRRSRSNGNKNGGGGGERASPRRSFPPPPCLLRCGGPSR